MVQDLPQHRLEVGINKKENKMNYQIEIFHQEIINILNKSGLPIGVAYYIMKDVLKELEDAYIQAINKEKNQTSEEVIEEIPVENFEEIKNEEKKEEKENE